MSFFITKSEDSIFLNKDYQNALSEFLKQITEKHTEVSKIKTPKAFIKDKMGYDYVEESYMRRKANELYPGWSFTIIDSQIVGSPALPKSMALKVHGRLEWLDNGLPRKGDMIAAHRIQFKREPNQDEVVDMGNDFKSAVSDCLKKAMNTYLNIADDVYRKADPTLNNEEKENLIAYAIKADMEVEEIKSKIEDGSINQTNYEASLRRLKKLIEEKK